MITGTREITWPGSGRDELPWVDDAKVFHISFSLLGSLASGGGAGTPGFGEYVVDHDTPFDPANAIITSACFSACQTTTTWFFVKVDFTISRKM